MPIKRYNNILIVSGTGRDSGKTTFICMLLGQYKHLNCTAIKIAPHFHNPTNGIQSLFDEGTYQIFKETDKTGNKDSQRMLASGAKEVYYIQCKDENLIALLDKLPIDPKNPVIIESGGIAPFIKNSLHICIKKQGSDKPCSPSDVILKSDNINFGINSLKFEKNCFVWHY